MRDVKSRSSPADGMQLRQTESQDSFSNMNRLKLLFAGSVALNAGLITLLILTRATTPFTERQAADARSPHVQAVSRDAPATDTDDPTPAARVAEYRYLFQALRDAGYADAQAKRTVRAIAFLDWAEYRERFFPGAAATGRGPAGPGGLTRTERRELVEARREFETILSEALGEPQSIEPRNDLRRYLPHSIGPEQARAVAWLEEDYLLLIENVPADDPDTLVLLLQARRDDLSSILSREEMEFYELRRFGTPDLLADHEDEAILQLLPNEP